MSLEEETADADMAPRRAGAASMGPASCVPRALPKALETLRIIGTARTPARFRLDGVAGVSFPPLPFLLGLTPTQNHLTPAPGAPASGSVLMIEKILA